MITEVDISLLAQPLDGFIHQANCFHIMGGGIARVIKQHYPELYKADCEHGPAGDITRLGSFSTVKCRDDKQGYNLYGQFDLGMGQRQTNYEAVYSGLTKIQYHALNNNIQTLGLPKNMGCRLGGGSWRVVRAMIDDIFEESEIALFICNYEG